MPKVRTTSPSVFSGRLVELRKSRHLTQEQLAEQLGLSRATIAYYEANATNPRLETIHKIAGFFEVEPESLITDKLSEHSRPGPVPRLEQQVARLRRLSPAKQRLASELLETFLKNA